MFLYARLPETFFSLIDGSNYYTVTSRQLVTSSLDPNNAEWSLLDQGTANVLMCEPEVISATTADADVPTENERTTNIVEDLPTTPVSETSTTFVSTTEVRTEGELSSTALLDMETVTEGMTGSTNVIQMLESSVQLAVLGSREGLSSRLQVQIMVCTLNMCTHS